MSKRDEHLKRLKNEPLYRFFTLQLCDVEEKIRYNSDQIKGLSEEQESLKRGRAELIKMRRLLTPEVK